MERGMEQAKKRQISRDMQRAQEEDRGLAVEKHIRAGSICEKVLQLYRQNFYKWWSCTSLYCENEKQVITNLHQHYENNWATKQVDNFTKKKWKSATTRRKKKKKRRSAVWKKKKKKDSEDKNNNPEGRRGKGKQWAREKERMCTSPRSSLRATNTSIIPGALTPSMPEEVNCSHSASERSSKQELRKSESERACCLSRRHLV